jgi:hypothetical protein
MARRLVVVLGAVLVLAVGFVLAGRSDKPSRAYDRADVDRAFSQQGFTLADSGLFGSGDQIEAVLFPVSGEPFFVYIARNDVAARQAFSPYARMRSPDTVQILRGNVMAASDSGLSRKGRQRVQAAMQALSAD